MNVEEEPEEEEDMTAGISADALRKISRAQRPNGGQIPDKTELRVIERKKKLGLQFFNLTAGEMAGMDSGLKAAADTFLSQLENFVSRRERLRENSL